MSERLEAGVFLEKRSYRRRRLLDGLRSLPFLGAWLFALPVFWPSAGDDGARLTSYAVMYIFGVWLALCVICVLLLSAYRRRRSLQAGEP